MVFCLQRGCVVSKAARWPWPQHRFRSFSLLSIFAVILWILCLNVAERAAEAQSQARKTLTEADRMCSEVRLILEAKIKADISSQAPGDQPHLDVCSQNSICCSSRMETQLQQQSRMEMKKIVTEKMQIQKQTFITWTAKFDAFFRNLMDKSKRSLHDMFFNAYGTLFEQNSQIFAQLFNDLLSHYKGADLSLDDALDRFFVSLLHKMFVLMNDDYVVSDDYLLCLTEHMEQVRPFNDVPQKLSSQIKRSFTAARALVFGLSQGKETILTMMKQTPDDECSRAVTNMLFCPFCQGLTSAPPCYDYCLGVTRACLGRHIQLQEVWNSYLEELLKVAGRLSGPFNIETVVGLLDIQISDAIKNFQDNVENITALVMHGCGDPPKRVRQRREAAWNETSSTYISSSSRSSSSTLTSSLSSSSLSSSSSSTTTTTMVIKQRQLQEEIEVKTQDDQRGQQYREEEQQRQRRQPEQGLQRQEPEEQDEQRRQQRQERQLRQERQHEDRQGQRQQQPHRQAQQSQRSEQRQRQRQQKQQRKQQPSSSSGDVPTDLERLVLEVRRKMEIAKDLWSSLPRIICAKVVPESGNDTRCWNGMEFSSRPGSGSGRGDKEVIPGDEVLNSVTNQEILRLRQTVNRLRQAYNGIDEWQDGSDDGISGNGMEFGSGSELEKLNNSTFTQTSSRVDTSPTNAVITTVRAVKSGSNVTTRTVFPFIIMLLVTVVFH